MPIHLRSIVMAVLLVAAAGSAWAQTPPSSASAPAAPAATPPAGLPTPPPNFLYAPEGRRDPFVNIFHRGIDPRAGDNTKRPEGAAGIPVAELMLRGTLQSRGAWTAMVSGADKKVYVVRAGDKLADGVIRAITADAVVLLQEVNDPLSLDKRREVRKLLRGGDEVK